MNWKKVIVHCSATPNGDARFNIEDFRRWHMAKGWRDVGYNFVVEASGALSKGRSESGSGAHTQGQNSIALGICQVGTDKFWERQFLTTRMQILAWMKQYSIPVTEIYGHYQFASKLCPGFKIEPFRQFIETGDLSIMNAHILDPGSVHQPGEDMGAEEEVFETKNAIASIQTGLKGLGEKIVVDGIMGPKTKAAMIRIASR